VLKSSFFERLHFHQALRAKSALRKNDIRSALVQSKHAISSGGGGPAEKTLTPVVDI
jgi:hypothetical protein